MVEEFSGQKGVIGFLITTVRYKPVYDNAYMKTLRGARGARPAARLPFGAELGRSEHAHLQPLHRRRMRWASSWFNILHMTNWVVNGMPERFPKLEVDLDRKRASPGSRS